MQDDISILLVDDEDAIRDILTGELSANGYVVETASDGDEAIARIRIKSFDLAILDIKMVRVQGLEVLKFIKTNFPATKVIMLTAYADLKSAMDSKKLGADDFLTKPYDLGELIATIQNVFSR